MPAIKIHHTATEESAWDGPGAVAAMPNDDAVLRYCHAWQTQEAADADHKSDDDDVDDQKSSYKFPHHRKEGGPANLPACRNGLARLPNANIPDADRAGVKAHCQEHLDDGKSDDDTDNRGSGTLMAMRFPGEKGIDIANLAGRGGWQRALQLGQMTDDQRIKANLPRAKRFSDRTDWFRITDYTDGTPARLDIYDEIGWSWFGDGVTASSFNTQLQAVQAPSIELHINSPGGDVFDGLAILNLLRSHDKPIDVVIDGLAASAASFIAQAGDTITMMPNSQLMIHDASGICMGNSAEMADMAQLLDHMSQNIADVYAMRSGRSADEWRTAMKDETWYSADEAVTAGLADKVGELQRGQKQPEPVAAAHWNLSFYAHNGRADSPPPVVPAPSHTPAPPVPAGVAPVKVAARPGSIDPAVVRAAFRDAFRTSPKEAR